MASPQCLCSTLHCKGLLVLNPIPLHTPPKQRAKHKFRYVYKDPAAVKEVRRALSSRLVEYEGEVISVLEKARRIRGELRARVSSSLLRGWRPTTIHQIG